MPRGIEPQVFGKFGRVTITHEDSRNWSVSEPDKTTYHVSLPLAILAASHRVADRYKPTLLDWLNEYRKITRKMMEVFENKGIHRDEVETYTVQHVGLGKSVTSIYTPHKRAAFQNRVRSGK